jgi:hypothetical protein
MSKLGDSLKTPSLRHEYFDNLPIRIIERDPLAKLLFRLSGYSIARVIFIALATYGVLVIGASFLLSSVYLRKGFQFVSIFNTRELILTFLVNMFFYPLFWAIYVWQPRGVVDVFKKLYQNGVFVQMTYDSLHELINQKFVRVCQRRLLSMVPIALTLCSSIATGVPTLLNPSSPLSLSALGLPMWWCINPFYFWLIWLPLQAINVYMMVWAIIRQVLAIITFTFLFRSFEIAPKLFHPDRCNGLASIGDYTMRMIWAVILLGCWIAFTIAIPLFWGEKAGFTVPNTVSLLIYILAVPALLISPVWQAHIAMSDARSKALEDIALRMQEAILSLAVDVDQDTQSMEQFDRLERRYNIIYREYRTWPFRPLAFTRISIAAFAPVLSTLVSYVIDKLLK